MLTRKCAGMSRMLRWRCSTCMRMCASTYSSGVCLSYHPLFFVASTQRAYADTLAWGNVGITTMLFLWRCAWFNSHSKSHHPKSS